MSKYAKHWDTVGKVTIVTIISFVIISTVVISVVVISVVIIPIIPIIPIAKKPKPRILSGIQPTGSLHLGNYLGALSQWVPMQDNYDCNFCVVDLHAVTNTKDHKLQQSKEGLRESTMSSAALYIAAGIDPDKSNIFVQSHVSAHSELAWLLTCTCPMGWMDRMIQFKEKKASKGDNVGLGLYSYPVLMAADILLYGAEKVPVGEDQRQHLELTRDLARRFNDQFCTGSQYKKLCKSLSLPTYPVFREPEAMIVKEGARVMSLTDGTSKMSKSDPSEASRINVLDPPDVIAQKIKRCKTDNFEGIVGSEDRPEARNLITIFKAVQPGRDPSEVEAEVKDMNWGTFKPVLADAVIQHLSPIQSRYEQVRGEEGYLEGVLKRGGERANEQADQTLKRARAAMGFVPKF
ncbi:hypothetical protein TrRE_jg7509 [Triparma retinervis]|uniref:tryptophan--tRNA ligase n=1 Tax=Triparma retinervis TaxID=2557542 RepID=A0A9W7AFT2_9STRA|nr:hypothetical protein TrRE_jg7509 [Triparma retinervis]